MKHYKILLTCLNYRSLTGCELYNYELSRTLKEMGHDVTIAAQNVTPQEGVITLDEVNENDYDFRIASQEWCFPEKFNNIPSISVIHSEHQWFEKIIKKPNILYYVAVRPSIKQWLAEEGIDNCKLIWNPFDFDKFQPQPQPDSKQIRILFAGKLNRTRMKPIVHFTEICKRNGWKMVLCGEDPFHFLKQHMSQYPNVIEYHKPTPDIDKLLATCHYTAGIYIGRTTIEGWLQGKDGWVYDLGRDGKLTPPVLMRVPNDLTKFERHNVAQQIVDIYESSLGRDVQM